MAGIRSEIFDKSKVLGSSKRNGKAGNNLEDTIFAYRQSSRVVYMVSHVS